MARRPTGLETRKTSKGETRYRGVVNLKATGKQASPWGSYSEAVAWLAKARGEAANGTRRVGSPLTLREAWEAFYAAAKAGTANETYKPSTLRGYERAWRLRIDPALGAHRLDSIRRADLQGLVDQWAADGVPAATIRNTLDPIRTLYRRAMQRDQVAINPTVNLVLPRVSNGRERFATREEAADLIATLKPEDQALWATAFYAGLRRGELRGLRWEHVDLSGGLIYVRRSWDDEEGDSDPKTRAAVRRVPIVPPLAALLAAHREAAGRDGDELVFGRSATEPFIPSTVRNRALAAWKAENKRRAAAKGGDPLEPIGLHEARHTFASLMIAAGAHAKALSVVMGHTSISTTFDIYGKLMPGGETEVGRLLGEYLAA